MHDLQQHVSQLKELCSYTAHGAAGQSQSLFFLHTLLKGLPVQLGCQDGRLWSTDALVT